ncbi:MAG: hypothetical protein IJV64_08660 [Oscillospiraceae bacterium]|nr:hypothetical protein [Oscillospiraceae bacterium]
MLKRIPLLLMAVLLPVSCDIHQEPVGDAAVSLTLHLRFETAIEPGPVVEYATKSDAPASAAAGENEARYTVRLYRYVSDTWDPEPAYEMTFYDKALADRDLDCDVELPVEPANYRVAVWADYVQDGEGRYDASDFGAVQMAATAGCDEHRAAWFCTDDLPLASILTAGASWEQTLVLRRPHARYRVIATDVEEFLNYWAGQLALRDGTMVKDPEALDISKFRVRYSYPQYLPSAFGLFSDRPVDARTGVSFEAPMTVLPDGTVDLGFDYVFVAGDGGSVTVSLAFYDEKGERVSGVEGLEVPLERSKLTTVRGKVLTSGIDSGISIDPTYDGEYNVIL